MDISIFTEIHPTNEEKNMSFGESKFRFVNHIVFFLLLGWKRVGDDKYCTKVEYFVAATMNNDEVHPGLTLATDWSNAIGAHVVEIIKWKIEVKMLAQWLMLERCYFMCRSQIVLILRINSFLINYSYYGAWLVLKKSDCRFYST